MERGQEVEKKERTELPSWRVLQRTRPRLVLSLPPSFHHSILGPASDRERPPWGLASGVCDGEERRGDTGHLDICQPLMKEFNLVENLKQPCPTRVLIGVNSPHVGVVSVCVCVSRMGVSQSG